MIRPDEYFVLFTCGLSLVMAAGLLIEYPMNFRKKILAIALIPMAYIQFFTFLLTTKLLYKIPGILFTPVPFGFCIAPFLYFYVRTFLQENSSLVLRDFLHFTPPVLFAILLLPASFIPVEIKIRLINQIYEGLSLYSVMAIMVMLFSCFYSFKLIVKIVKVFHKENPVHKRFLVILSFMLTWIIITVLKIIGLIFINVHFIRLSNMFISIDVLVLYFSFHKMPFLLNYANLTVEKEKSKSKSLLNGIDIQKLKNEVEIIMDKERLYCDEDLSLSRLAHALEITPHQLSAFLNEYYGKNFNTYINGFRVQYALSLLTKDPDASTLSVAFASGFNSYSAFFSAFKKETGMSPAELKTAKKS